MRDTRTWLPTYSPVVTWLKMSDICNGSSHEQDLQMESIQILQKEIRVCVCT